VIGGIYLGGALNRQEVADRRTPKEVTADSLVRAEEADPFEAGMDHEAEARARHTITGPSKFVPRVAHEQPPEE
jgi:hypothetical protein